MTTLAEKLRQYAIVFDRVQDERETLTAAGDAVDERERYREALKEIVTTEEDCTVDSAHRTTGVAREIARKALAKGSGS